MAAVRPGDGVEQVGLILLGCREAESGDLRTDDVAEGREHRREGGSADGVECGKVSRGVGADVHGVQFNALPHQLSFRPKRSVEPEPRGDT